MRLIVIGVNVGATTDTTPDALKPPRNATLLLAAHGEGVQIYTCQSAKDDASRFSWTLAAPEASIADQDGKPVGKHYAGPTWEAGDGSKVVGEVIARDDGPDASAIPWLLLRAKSASGHGRLGAVTFIQRLHTVGGQSPTAGCSAATVDHVVRVDYSADYNFYVATGAAIASSAPTDPRTPLGLWETFDDKTGAARALIRIYGQDGKLFGRVEQSFTPGAEARVCAVCSDERRISPSSAYHHSQPAAGRE